jgi:hypothetical protein
MKPWQYVHLLFAAETCRVVNSAPAFFSRSNSVFHSLSGQLGIISRKRYTMLSVGSADGLPSEALLIVMQNLNV